MADPINLSEYEAIARSRLDESVYDYFAGGANDEITVRANAEAFHRMSLAPHVLVDVSDRDLSTHVFETPLPHPIVLSPTALHRMAHTDGERATARAAQAEGALMCLSSTSSVAMGDVMAAAPEGPKWFQLYRYSEPGLTERFIAHAAEAGYRAIVLTVDAPLLGRRERDLRNPFVIPQGVAAVNFGAHLRTTGTESLQLVMSQAPMTWSDIAWIKSLSRLPLVIKGVVRGDDAKHALDLGVDGLWVSNHGGRQLDTAVTTADALPAIVAAVAGRAPVIVDGGVRRGTDVLKALALGADLVAIGRPQLWGLAADGEDGVRKVIRLLVNELSLAMALAGCKSLAEIDASLLA
jgi:4-hydroxymandelate oxidase